MIKIGKRIKRLRMSVPKRTQGQFAKLLGVERGAVGNWERGKGISRDNIEKMSTSCRVPTGWIMSGPDEGPIPFIGGEEIIVQAAGDPSLRDEEAEAIISWTIQALGREPEAEARILARAVLRAYRTPPTPPLSALSLDERRKFVFEAIRLFRTG
jgi:transcriptional regulator with XRE-family HTH domain